MKMSVSAWLSIYLSLLVVVGAVWSPTPGTTWQWQLTQTIDTSVDVTMYDIDLYEATDADIATLKAANRIVICYFSAGTAENFRDDYSHFPQSTLGSVLPEWQDERWVDIRAASVRSIMAARLQYAQTRGCDGVEPDNVDAFDNDNGLGITPADQLDYNHWLAQKARNLSLSVGLKNDLSQVSALVDDFDWAINEECIDYDECSELQPFLDRNKAVFHVEYVGNSQQGAAKHATVCAHQGRPATFSTLIKVWDLDAWRLAC